MAIMLFVVLRSHAVQLYVTRGVPLLVPSLSTRKSALRIGTIERSEIHQIGDPSFTELYGPTERFTSAPCLRSFLRMGAEQDSRSATGEGCGTGRGTRARGGPTGGVLFKIHV